MRFKPARRMSGIRDMARIALRSPRSTVLRMSTRRIFRGHWNEQLSVQSGGLSFNFESLTAGQLRGLFGYRSRISFRDVTDGLSNTAMLSEGIRPPGSGGGAPANQFGAATTANTTNPAACKASYVNGTYSTALLDRNRSQGTRWCDGRAGYINFTTILAPNSAICNGQTTSGILTPSSRHTGGVQVCLADGSVRFISENIDAGNPAGTFTYGAASPYGVWGALGSRNGGEVIGEF
ncbi:MAG: DUF1559 domain-containing protein [Planctomycetaceae bacterium]